jgi:hypothetical protein
MGVVRFGAFILGVPKGGLVEDVLLSLPWRGLAPLENGEAALPQGHNTASA